MNTYGGVTSYYYLLSMYYYGVIEHDPSWSGLTVIDFLSQPYARRRSRRWLTYKGVCLVFVPICLPIACRLKAFYVL